MEDDDVFINEEEVSFRWDIEPDYKGGVLYETYFGSHNYGCYLTFVLSC